MPSDTPEDLYDLANQAGIFSGTSYDENLPNFAPQPADPALGPGSRVENHAAAALGPGLDAPDPSILGSAAFSPQGVGSPGGPGMDKLGASLGVSSNYRGFSPDKMKQVQASWGGASGQMYNQAGQVAQSQMDPAIDEVQKARQSEIDGKKAVANAMVGIEEGKGHEALFMKRVQDEFADKETQIHAHYTALENEAKSNYVTALNDFRASGVNPSQLFGNMTKGEQFGMAVSAFVHDFLGVKGMKTSAMDTFNKAVDRNIDAQVQAIKVKGEVTQGFKTLWDMQRAQSASDAEARERVRGFILESAKQQVISNMSKYNSALASAQGKDALGAIDAEAAKTLGNIYMHISSNSNTLRGQAIQLHGDELRAANEAYGNSLKAQELAMHTAAAAAKAKSDALRGLVADPSTTGKGLMKWRIRDDFQDDKGLVEKINNKVAATATVTKDIEEYKGMVRKYDSLPTQGLAKSTWADTHQQQMRSLQLRIIQNYRKSITGAQFGPEEAKEYEAMIPLDAWTNRGNVESVVSQFEKSGINDLETYLTQYATRLDPDVSAALAEKGIVGSAPGGFAPGETADATQTAANAGETTKTTFDTANNYLAAPSKDKGKDVTKEASKDDLLNATHITGYNPKKEWGDFSNENLSVALGAAPKSQFGPKAVGGPTNSSLGILTLRASALGGDKKALEALGEYAGLHGAAQHLPNGVDANSKEGILLRNFAMYEFKKLQEDMKKLDPATEKEPAEYHNVDLSGG